MMFEGEKGAPLLGEPLLEKEDADGANGSLGGSKEDRYFSSFTFTTLKRFPFIIAGMVCYVLSLLSVLGTQISKESAVRAIGNAYSLFVLFLLLGWIYGIDLSICQKYKIPMVSLLGLKVSPSGERTMNPGRMFTYVGSASVLVFVGTSLGIAAERELEVLLALWIVCTLYWIGPSPIPFRSARWKLLEYLKESVLAAVGLCPVKFWHTFVTDGLTSASGLFYQVQSVHFCYPTTAPTNTRLFD